VITSTSEGPVPAPPSGRGASGILCEGRIPKGREREEEEKRRGNILELERNVRRGVAGCVCECACGLEGGRSLLAFERLYRLWRGMEPPSEAAIARRTFSKIAPERNRFLRELMGSGLL
jgi:hypothetical protein